MNSFTACTFNEIEKMIRRKKAIIYFFIALLIPAGMAVGLWLIQNRVGVSPSLDFPIFTLGMFTNYLLPLFIFTLGADLFAGEAADRTLKLTMTRPVSRFHVFAAKNTAIALYGVVILAAVYIVSMISWLVLDVSGVTSAGILEGLKAYGVAIIPMLLVTIIASFLSQLFKSSSGALTASLLFYIACWALSFLSPVISRLSPFHYIDWHLLWVGQTAGFSSMLIAFLFLFSYSLLFFIGGYGLFDRKQL